MLLLLALTSPTSVQEKKELLVYFAEHETNNGNFVYCQDIQGLLEHMGVEEYVPDEWRLFVDSNKRSLKCVLLHNGNDYASVSHRTLNSRERKVRRNQNGFEPY